MAARMKFPLDTFCANCKKQYGQHRTRDDACPVEKYLGRQGGFHVSNTFAPLADWEVELLRNTGHLNA